MKIIKDLFYELYHKNVEIYTMSFGAEAPKKYVGNVVGCYSSDSTFLVLDTKEIINTRYILSINIID